MRTFFTVFRWCGAAFVASALASTADGQSFTINTVAGNGQGGFSGDGGPAVEAELRNPSGVAVARDGSLIIADLKNNRIRKVDPDGTITTVAGDGGGLPRGDGGPAAEARVGNAYGVAIDNDGNIYLGDRMGYRVRRIDRQGVITRFAGNGRRGDSGDGGPAVDAQVDRVNDIAIGADGRVYLADAGNHRIRVVDNEGTITTFAGTGTEGYSGDGGPASSAELNAPSALCIDARGALYFCDFGNHCVRKVAADGTVSTVAGTGKPGWGGDGKLAITAKLFEPCGVAVDALGRVYIADSANAKIRVVCKDGTIHTVAGTGRAGYSGDGGPANRARIAVPDLIDVDAAGNIYIAEYGNHVIRQLTPNEPTP